MLKPPDGEVVTFSGAPDVLLPLPLLPLPPLLPLLPLVLLVCHLPVGLTERLWTHGQFLSLPAQAPPFHSSVTFPNSRRDTLKAQHVLKKK